MFLPRRRVVPAICLIALTFTVIILWGQHAFMVINKLNMPAELYELEMKRRAASTSPPPTTSVPLQQRLKCTNRELQFEKLQYGSYWLLRNFVRGSISRNVRCDKTITHTTQGDYTFLNNLPYLIVRWMAPISLALYAPGHDLNATVESIQYVRNCLDESDLIREYVTFHIYFPFEHMPQYVPLDEEAALKWPYNCAGNSTPYENVDRKLMYKQMKNLTYPINVGRNIARLAVNTYFIFASDLELLPSRGLVKQFLELVARNHSAILGDGTPQTKRVFTMPVFEVHKTATIPAGKTELVAMLRSKKAIPFHSKICKSCHLVPKQAEWVNATLDSEMTIFSSTKREGKHKVWEPFYISDNKEPLFDERVTWEGQKNKRIQGFAMCLLNYDYFVLHPPFLVHMPGIKYFDSKSPRLKYVNAMNTFIDRTIIPEYRIIYSNNNRRCGP